jgi:Protein of unknown function (DUF2934)
MKNTIEHSVGIKESEIGLVAYQMWEKAGHPPGRDLQFWLDAEAQLRLAAKAAFVPHAPLSPVASEHNTVHKAARVELGPSQPISTKARQKSRWF